MKIIELATLIIICSSLTGCDNIASSKNDEMGKSDTIPSVILKNGNVYQYILGEYVKIPFSGDIPKDKLSKEYDSEISNTLVSNIKLYYGYNEVYYKITIKLNPSLTTANAKENSDRIELERLKLSSLTLLLNKGDYPVAKSDLVQPSRVIDSYQSGLALYSSLQYAGSIPLGPNRFMDIDAANISWR